MTQTVVSLGELMMRLSPPGKLRLRQAQMLDICHGGAEANVAVSLAGFGLSSRFVSALPDTELGEQGERFLRANGVDVAHVQKKPGRMGLYFMEDGADFRSGCVIYDRAGSAFTSLAPIDIDWDQVFDGAGWFHISGITPAISTSTRDLALAAVREAKGRGVHVSLDLNHRERLWQYGQDATEVMPELVRNADTLIAGRGDCIACLGFSPDGDGSTDDWYEALSADAMARFPNLERVSITIRNSSSAERHHWKAHIRTASESLFSRDYDMQQVVDRVGTGDAFSAGLVYGLFTGKSAQDAIDFAAAANCLKHTIIGDANMVTADEVEALAASTSHGRLRR
ncbi:MAG: sugar kinase [Henriciella sp.]